MRVQISYEFPAKLTDRARSIVCKLRLVVGVQRVCAGGGGGGWQVDPAALCLPSPAIIAVDRVHTLLCPWQPKEATVRKEGGAVAWKPLRATAAFDLVYGNNECPDYLVLKSR